jgi:Mycobacterium membrane protein
VADFQFTTGPEIVGNVVAQDDSAGIGCRFPVDGVVKGARISHKVNAFAFCVSKAA